MKLSLTDRSGQVVQADTVIIDDTWEIELWADETANDSDKNATADATWHILWVWVEFTTTATVGDRQIYVEIQDSGSDVIAQFRARVVQAASLTYYYMFGPSLAQDTEAYEEEYLTTPLPPTLILKSGDIIRVYDANAVAAAADDMVIQMQYGSKA